MFSSGWQQGLFSKQQNPYYLSRQDLMSEKDAEIENTFIKTINCNLKRLLDAELITHNSQL